MIPNIWENKTCSKPPTSDLGERYTFTLDELQSAARKTTSGGLDPVAWKDVPALPREWWLPPGRHGPRTGRSLPGPGANHQSDSAGAWVLQTNMCYGCYVCGVVYWNTSKILDILEMLWYFLILGYFGDRNTSGYLEIPKSRQVSDLFKYHSAPTVRRGQKWEHPAPLQGASRSSHDYTMSMLVRACPINGFPSY